eukprot:scaffold166735_cov20-Prasinocladus_malaysianus.AAC.1
MLCSQAGLGHMLDNHLERLDMGLLGSRTLLKGLLLEAGATTGKRGLGRANMPKKVAGARFTGKKIKITDDSDDETEQGPAASDGTKDKDAEVKDRPGISCSEPAAGGLLVGVKWKKIATRILRETNGSMK